jgi:hypothetical protein
MKPNTALCFLLSGLTLCLTEPRQLTTFRRRVPISCAIAVVAIASVTLLQYVTASNFHFDDLLFREAVRRGPPTPFPGRMASATALALTLTGLSLLCLQGRLARRMVLGEATALAAVAIGLIAVLGYLYGIASLYAFRPYESVSLPTAILLVVVAFGALAVQPSRPVVVVVMGSRAGGAMARRTLPFALVVPVVLAWLRLAGQRAGYYDTEFGLAIFALSNVAIFAALIWLTARWLNACAAANEMAAEELRRAKASLERRVLERTAELSAAKERAEVADRHKTEFLHDMSHELRTPLNAILGFTGTQLMGLAGPLSQEQRDQLYLIDENGRRLLSVIEGLLETTEPVPTPCGVNDEELESQ